MGRKQTLGFTFIELMVAVSIVAVLASLSVANFIEQSKKGRDSERKSDLGKLRVVLEDYYNDRSCYPRQAEMSCSPGTVLLAYTPKIPCDPQTGASYSYAPGGDSNCPSSYILYAKLEYRKDPDIAKSGCLPSCGPGGSYNFKVSSPNAQ